MKIRDKVLSGRKCLLKEENCYHTKFYISKKYRYSVGARSLSSLKCLYGEPTRISQPSARFTGHNSCDSRNMNFWKCHMISSSKGHVTLRMGASNCESAFCLFSCSWIFCRWRCNVFNLLRDITWPLHSEGMRIYRWELLVLCHYSDKSCERRHCEVEIRSKFVTWSRVSLCWKSYMNLWVEARHGESLSCHIWWPLV